MARLCGFDMLLSYIIILYWLLDFTIVTVIYEKCVPIGIVFKITLLLIYIILSHIPYCRTVSALVN